MPDTAQVIPFPAHRTGPRVALRPLPVVEPRGTVGAWRPFPNDPTRWVRERDGVVLASVALVPGGARWAARADRDARPVRRAAASLAEAFMLATAALRALGFEPEGSAVYVAPEPVEPTPPDDAPDQRVRALVVWYQVGDAMSTEQLVRLAEQFAR